MKIVDLKTFREMPEGIFFSKYTPYVFGAICIKGETIPGDFYALEIASAVKCEDSDDLRHQLDHAIATGESLDMDLNAFSRDAEFARDQLFAVWEDDAREALGDRAKYLHHRDRNRD